MMWSMGILMVKNCLFGLDFNIFKLLGHDFGLSLRCCSATVKNYKIWKNQRTKRKSRSVVIVAKL